jgi:hypothetical protein
VPFEVPDVLDAAGLAQAFDNLVRAMAGGEITPDEAATAATVLEGRRRSLETEQLEERLREVEEQLQHSSGVRPGVLRFPKTP